MSGLLDKPCCICGEVPDSIYTAHVKVEEGMRIYSGHKRCLPSPDKLLASDAGYEVIRLG